MKLVTVIFFCMFVVQNSSSSISATLHTNLNKDRQRVASIRFSTQAREFCGDLSAYCIMQNSQKLQGLLDLEKSLEKDRQLSIRFNLETKDGFTGRFLQVYNRSESIYQSYLLVVTETAIECMSSPFKSLDAFIDYASKCDFINKNIRATLLFRRAQYGLSDEL